MTKPAEQQHGRQRRDDKGHTPGLPTASASKDDGDKSRLGELLEHAGNEIHVIDARTLRLEMLNTRARGNLGYTSEELARLTILDIIPESGRQAYETQLQELGTGTTIQTVFRTRHRRRDGSEYPVQTHLQYLDRPAGPVFIAWCFDATGTGHSEPGTEEVENHLDTLLNSATQFIYLLDIDGRIRSVNRYLLQKSGFSGQEMLGRPIQDFFSSESQLTCTREFPRLRECGRNRARIEFICKDGRVLQMDCLGTAIRDREGNTTAFLIIQNDVTEQLRSSAALEDMERFLDSIIENIPDMVFIKDAKELRFLRVNRAAEKLIGLPREKLIGRNDHDFFPVEQADYFTSMDHKTLTSRETVVIPQEEIDTADRGRRLLHTKKVPVLDDSGQARYLLGLSEDITERVAAEQALLESERRFRAIFNSTFQFIGILSPDGILLEANRTALEFIGKTSRDVVGKYFWDTDWWNDTPEGRSRLREAVHRAAQGELVRFETAHTGRDGKTYCIDFSLKPVSDDSGEVVLLIPEGRDITDRIRAEQESRRYQQQMAHTMRINTIGEMAASLAHELNQPLTALISYCGTAENLLSGAHAPVPEVQDILRRATEQAHRAGRIIHRIRHYIRNESPAKETLDIDSLLGNACHLLEWELKNSAIDLSYDLHCPDCRVHVEKIQIEQVLINLLRNSIDAITKHGHDAKIILQSRRISNQALEVGVIDNGPGIPHDMIHCLFKPYRTSKGRGMGLGLSISHSIIERHGGKLFYDDSLPGKSAFRFTLPILTETAAEGQDMS